MIAYKYTSSIIGLEQVLGIGLRVVTWSLGMVPDLLQRVLKQGEYEGFGFRV